MEQAKLIIIDDSPVSSHLIECFLDKYPSVSTQSFSEPQKAIEYILEHADSIDLIFSDLHMPLMTGPEIFQKLKENHLDIPFVIVSGDSQKSLLANAIQQGVSGFLVKPIDRKKLIHICQRHLGEKHIPS